MIYGEWRSCGYIFTYSNIECIWVPANGAAKKLSSYLIWVDVDACSYSNLALLVSGVILLTGLICSLCKTLPKILEMVYSTCMSAEYAEEILAAACAITFDHVKSLLSTLEQFKYVV